MLVVRLLASARFPRSCWCHLVLSCYLELLLLLQELPCDLPHVLRCENGVCLRAFVTTWTVVLIVFLDLNLTEIVRDDAQVLVGAELTLVRMRLFDLTQVIDTILVHCPVDIRQCVLLHLVEWSLSPIFGPCLKSLLTLCSLVVGNYHLVDCWSEAVDVLLSVKVRHGLLSLRLLPLDLTCKCLSLCLDVEQLLLVILHLN